MEAMSVMMKCEGGCRNWSQVDGLDTYDTVKLHQNGEVCQMDRV